MNPRSLAALALAALLSASSRAEADYPCGAWMKQCPDGSCQYYEMCDGVPDIACGFEQCCQGYGVDYASGDIYCLLCVDAVPFAFDPCPSYQACEKGDPRDATWTHINLWTQSAIHSAYAFTLVVNDSFQVPIEFVCDDAESESVDGPLGWCWKSTLDETIVRDDANLVLRSARGDRTYYPVPARASWWRTQSESSAYDGTLILHVNDRFYLIDEEAEMRPFRVFARVADEYRLTRIEQPRTPYEPPALPSPADGLGVDIERHASNGRIKAIRSPRGAALDVNFVYQGGDPTGYLTEVRGPRYDPARPDERVWKFFVDPATAHFFAFTAPSADGTKALTQWVHYGDHHLIDRIQYPDRTQVTYGRKENSGRILNTALRQVSAVTSMPTDEASAPSAVGEAKAEVTIGQCGGGEVLPSGLTPEVHTTVTLPFGRTQETYFLYGMEPGRHLVARTVDEHGVTMDQTYDDRDRLDRTSYVARDGHTY